MRANLNLFQLFCVLLCAVTSASAALLFHPSEVTRVEKRALPGARGATRMTNAQRMAAGLPPLPPRTRTSTAKRSGVSQISVTSRIQVRDLSDNTRGEISKSTGAFGKFFLNTGSIFNSNTWSATVAQVGTTTQLNWNDVGRNRYLAGVITPTGTNDLSTSSAIFGYLGLSDGTPPGSGPQTGKNPSGAPTAASETAIWTYDASTRAITAQWVMSDGSTPSTTIFFDPDTAQFCLTLSPALFQANHLNAYIVNFYLV